MTCPSFDKSWLYKMIHLTYEKGINRHYLAAVLQVFSDSAGSARFLSPICYQVPLAGFFDF